MIKKQNKLHFFALLLMVISTFLFVNTVNSQQLNYTLNRDYLWGVDSYYNSKEQSFQTFVKPYRFADINQMQDSTLSFYRLLSKKKSEKQEKEKPNLVEIQPLLVEQIGYQANLQSNFTNDVAIGGKLVYTYGNKFALNFKALTGKATYTGYTDSVISQTFVVPGIGYAYRSNKDSLNPQYTYQYYSGYLSYSPNKIFNIQVGQDKQFWGEGYRSLFLSDVAAPYPYMKITTNIWHLSYVNLYTILKDATNRSGFKKDWLNKYATFHYLGWNATKRITIGFFESIVWQGTDSNRYRGYDINYLNPVIFFRPTEYSLGSSDNANIGFCFKLKMFKKQQLYGQLLLDEFVLKNVVSRNGWWANKQAYQAGFKSFDLFKIKRLNFQTEFNYVRPYTYSHGSVQQNYAHFNEPLAHPLGANFLESASFLNYRYKRLFVEAKCVYAMYGADSAGKDYGKNIFISYVNHNTEYGNAMAQGVKTTLITASLRAAYILDTDMNLKIELGVSERIEHTATITKQIPYVFFGIRADLCNLYTDY